MYMKYLTLQDDSKIIVDDDLFDELNQYTWTANYGKNNLRTNIYTRNKKGESVPLLSLIKKDSTQIIKNNDFRRSNLTVQNKNRYKRPSRRGSSWYKGVFYDKRYNKYRVQIKGDEKIISIGAFDNQDDAARAYNDAVDQYFNGFGYKNVIGVDNRDFNDKPNETANKNPYKRGRERRKYVNIQKRPNGKYRAFKRINGKGYHFCEYDNLEHTLIVYNFIIDYLFDGELKPHPVEMTPENKTFLEHYKEHIFDKEKFSKIKATIK